MGLRSWLFPSDADRLARARRLLDAGHWVDARAEALGVGGPEGQTLAREAEDALCRLNLEHAVGWAEAGDDERTAEHLELAEGFHGPHLDEEFRAARGRIRELRAARTAAARRAREEREARLLTVDPLGLAGGPSHLRPPLPDDLADEDAVELAARLDLILENYPEDLRERVGELGPDFARAVLDLDGGRPDLALQGLLALDDHHPLVCWETARTAHALGDAQAAARTLHRFADLAGGHRVIGQLHTGVFLAQLLAETGDVGGALRVLRDVRTREPDAGGFLFAQLLVTVGELPEAEQVVRGLLHQSPRYLPFYALLARIRLMGGYRVEAMAALEQAMAQTCGSPGQCGYMPPDPGIVRQLAILYLEDGTEPARGLELAEQARRMIRERGWDDLYLEALAARARQDGAAPRLVEQVWADVSEGDPRHAHLQRYLPLPA